MSGAKVIQGLKEAIAGDFSRVTIEGQVWIRSDLSDRKDAAYFRAMLDDFFHNAPIEADGTIKLSDCARTTLNELSRHTYKNGKQGVINARTTLKE